MFTSVVVSGSGNIYSTCPTGYQLLSCGMDNTQTSYWEEFRSSRAINSQTCECYDYYGMYCVAWCTTLPIKGFEVMVSHSSNIFSVSCSSGKQAMSCNIDPTTSSAEVYREYYPSSSGGYCTCYDYYGADCITTCSTQVKNYEVVSAWGAGYITVTCTQPTNRVLGCGINPNGSPTYERFRTTRAFSGNSCRCYDGYGTNCYAICGQIW